MKCYDGTECKEGKSDACNICFIPMSEAEWLNNVASSCTKAKTVRGGAMCHYYEYGVNYCTYEKCPRRKNVQ